MIEGRLCRAIPIIQPGMFLSHPGIVMLASCAWAHVTVSTESAMISRVCREKRIPVGR